MIYKDIIIGLWVVFVAFWIISMMSAKRAASRGLGKFIGFRFGVFIIIFLLLQSSHVRNFLATHSFVSHGTLLPSIAVLLTALGIGIAIWARVYLGRNWGMPMSLRQGHELVTSGPYKIIRHPIYTGMLLAMAGTFFVFGISWGFIFIIAAAYFIYSAFVEEQTMGEQFPNEYPAYKKATWMLIPFIF